MIWAVLGKDRALGHNAYCGPAAVSVLTGCSTGLAARWLAHADGHRPESKGRGVIGSSIAQVTTTLEALGYRAERLELDEDCTTLNRFVEDELVTGEAYLVWVPGHWIVLHRRDESSQVELIDSLNPNGAPYDDHADRGDVRLTGRRRVKGAWLVTPAPGKRAAQRRVELPLPPKWGAYYRKRGRIYRPPERVTQHGLPTASKPVSRRPRSGSRRTRSRQDAEMRAIRAAFKREGWVEPPAQCAWCQEREPAHADTVYCSDRCRHYGNRDAAAVIAKGFDEDRACEWCTKPIQMSASLRQRFCSGRCRVASHRARAASCDNVRGV